MRRRLLLKGLGPLAALMGMLFSAPADAQQSVPIESARQLRPILQRRIPDAGRRGSLAFARTELYFGTAKSDGTVVTEEEFRAFIDEVITPRFPDGLTVLKGDGQFRLDDGTVIKEQSFVVILLYSSETQKESSRTNRGHSAAVPQPARPGIGAARRRSVLRVGVLLSHVHGCLR